MSPLPESMGRWLEHGGSGSHCGSRGLPDRPRGTLASALGARRDHRWRDPLLQPLPRCRVHTAVMRMLSLVTAAPILSMKSRLRDAASPICWLLQGISRGFWSHRLALYPVASWRMRWDWVGSRYAHQQLHNNSTGGHTLVKSCHDDAMRHAVWILCTTSQQPPANACQASALDACSLTCIPPNLDAVLRLSQARRWRRLRSS